MSNTRKKHGNGNVKEMKIKRHRRITSTNANTTSTNIRSRDVLHEQNQTIYPHSGLSNLLQLMSKMDTRLNSSEKKVTKSVDELDEIKTSIKFVTQKVSTVEREVTALKQKYTEIEVHIQGIGNLFDETKEACKENETEIMKVKRENIAVKAKLSEMETDIRTFKNERGNHYWT